MQNKTDPSHRQWTIGEIVRWTVDYFKSRDIESPRASAEILLAHSLRLRRIDLYLRYDQPLLQSELSDFKHLIQQRVKHRPVAYITGRKEFWSLEFIVSEHCLIPRPETECLVEAALSILSETPSRTGSVPTILELGTGSGAIIVSLAVEKPGCMFSASDRCPHAIAVAKHNARCHGVDNRIHFFVGDWLSPLHPSAGFDLILSNPPYISTAQIVQLQPEIQRYEPGGALDGGEEGLSCLVKIMAHAHRHLNPGGRLILEIGSDQKERVVRLGMECGHYDEPIVKKDYAGLDRIVVFKTRVSSS
jgi:release factor glutamine methyltransferase